jgi:hypothetical protein
MPRNPDAKAHLIRQTLIEADREGIPLRAAERQMLLTPSEPDAPRAASR